jgi:hypothetical protein
MGIGMRGPGIVGITGLLSALLVGAPWVWGTEGAGPRGTTPLGVTSASGDASTRLLRIRGRLLLGGAGEVGLVAVRVGGIDLAVVSASEEGIEASCRRLGRATMRCRFRWRASGRGVGGDDRGGAGAVSPESQPLRLREGERLALTPELRARGHVTESVDERDVVGRAKVLLNTSATLIQAQLPGDGGG